MANKKIKIGITQHDVDQLQDALSFYNGAVVFNWTYDDIDVEISVE
tara:strand:+ start:35026 stop:35163 length:138 start_codon:yes stop_codon:yes gene_type:complete